MVREQMESLQDLARLDRGFRQLDAEQEELQGRLEELRQDVARIHSLLDRERVQIEETERLRVQSVQEAADLGERQQRSSARGNVARNTREQEASRREVEVLKKEREERLARAKELESGLSAVRESLARHEIDFAGLQQTLELEESRAATEEADIARRRLETEAERTALSARVRPDLLRRYSGVRSKRSTAVAEVRDGACLGCHVGLPPQFAAKVHYAEDILQCPNCHRLLVIASAPTGATTP
ncbi:MAG: C4-type zinc ribbon domain-containing protein [Deltaproteobacteria bacterium]|nr:C4-type zinc ribbon domain-containing protein [Deltaproteobacteria bacterium]